MKRIACYITLLCILVSCSTTKHLPEGEVLYIGQKSTLVDNPTPTDVGETAIEEVNAEKKKLKVMVKVFGRKTPLELAYTQVEKE